MEVSEDLREDKDRFLPLRMVELAQMVGVSKRSCDKWCSEENWKVDHTDGQHVYYSVPTDFIELKRRQQEERRAKRETVREEIFNGSLVTSHSPQGIHREFTEYSQGVHSELPENSMSITWEEYGNIRQELGKYQERCRFLEKEHQTLKLLTDTSSGREQTLIVENETLKRQLFEREAKIKELEAKSNRPWWQFWG